MTTDDDRQAVEGEVVSDAYAGPGDWLSPADAARRLSISERTLWRRVTAGQYQRRIESGKAQILVPLAGSVPNATVVAVPDTNRHLSVAIIEELRRRDQDAQERLTRQAEEIGRLKQERDDLAARLAALEGRRRWFWERWLTRAVE